MKESLKILLAEDDTNIALALKILLRRAFTGATITTACDGQEALELLQQHSYDLLLSDWNMPRLTGMELLLRIRANPYTSQLPFLMLTARTDVNCDKAFGQSGATDCINKPFDNDKLIEKVIKLLNAATSQTPSTAPALSVDAHQTDASPPDEGRSPHQTRPRH